MGQATSADGRNARDGRFGRPLLHMGYGRFPQTAELLRPVW
jgi:hypothetical protein